MLNDYAYPTTMAEKALKLLHYAMLEQRPGKALELLDEANKQLDSIRVAIDAAIKG